METIQETLQKVVRNTTIKGQDGRKFDVHRDSDGHLHVFEVKPPNPDLTPAQIRLGKEVTVFLAVLLAALVITLSIYIAVKLSGGT